MTELARGTVHDRPWGLTLGALGVRGLTGQLKVQNADKRFSIAFDNGGVVAATSSLAVDSAARIALTNHLVSSTHVGEIARRLAAEPGRDEIEIIAAAAKLSIEQADRLRCRVIVQRTAHTFSLERGEFIVSDAVPAQPRCSIDVCPIIYLGALTNMTDQRLLAELGALGAQFQLKPGSSDALPRFGFTDAEQQLLPTLEKGATIRELQIAHRELDRRTILAMVYTLISGLACEVPAKLRTAPPRPDQNARPASGLPRFRPSEPVLAHAPPAFEPPDPVPRPLEPLPPGSVASDPVTARTRTNQLLAFVAVPRPPAAQLRPHSATPFGNLILPRAPAKGDAKP